MRRVTSRPHPMKQPATDLDRFFELAVDLLCIASFDGTIQRINPAWERTLGRSASRKDSQ